MTIALIIVLIALIIMYTAASFYFVASTFDRVERLKILLPIATIVNGLFFMFFTFYISDIRYEFFMHIGYLTLLYFEYWFLQNENDLALSFAVQPFVIGYTSKRTIAIATLSIIQGIPMSEMYSSFSNRLTIALITFFLSFLIAVFSKKTLNKKTFDLVFSDKKNVKFATRIMACMSIFLPVIIFLIDQNPNSTNYKIIYILLCMSALSSYPIAIAYAFSFAKTQLQIAGIESIKSNINKEQEQIHDLIAQSSKDDFTGLYKREVIINFINKFKTEKKRFFVAFLDMDGLKYVNDNHGHNEGDFYIKNVVHIIKETFPNCNIGRFGGDEFIVVGETDDYFTPTKLTVNCYHIVNNISKKFAKPYPTSISYGIERVDINDSRNTEDILKEADKKMYKFKRAHKKARG